MKFCRTLIAVGIVAALTPPVSAQDTATDMTAAYCMGALNEQITVESQMQGDATARQQKRKETVDSEIVTRKRAEVRQYALRWTPSVGQESG